MTTSGFSLSRPTGGTLVCGLAAAAALLTYIWGRKSRYRRATSPLISLRFYDLDVPPASLEDVSSESRFEDVTSGTSLESMPQSSNHISDLRTFLFLDFADEEDLTERSLHPRDTAGYSFSSYVQRLMLSDHLTDIVNESPLSLRKLCKNFGVHEIAAPVHLVANLFSPVPQQKDTWTPYGDSSGPADEGQQSSTTLHLTLLDGGVEFLQETFRNASTSAERVNKLALISPESSRFLDSTSLFIFPNLTHLALSVASFDTIQLFQDLPNLQRLIFLTDRKGFERSTKGETKDVLMQHIFGNRKVLALPDVGKYTACRRNDPFVISWQENTMGLWEAAERYTTNESIKLLREYVNRDGELFLREAADLQFLVKFLTHGCGETCAIPLSNGTIPGEIVRRLVLAPHITTNLVSDPRSVIAALMGALANHDAFIELEVNSSWVDAMEMVTPLRTRENSDWPWELKISKWDRPTGVRWPVVSFPVLEQVSHLHLPDACPTAVVRWNTFKRVAILDVSENLINEIEINKARMPFLRKVVLHCTYGEVHCPDRVTLQLF